MTAIKTAMKEIKEVEDVGWVLYTDSLKSKLAIENNRENQMRDILTVLHSQGKHLTLCKVPAHRN